MQVQQLNPYNKHLSKFSNLMLPNIFLSLKTPVILCKNCQMEETVIEITFWLCSQILNPRIEFFTTTGSSTLYLITPINKTLFSTTLKWTFHHRLGRISLVCQNDKGFWSYIRLTSDLSVTHHLYLSVVWYRKLQTALPGCILTDSEGHRQSDTHTVCLLFCGWCSYHNNIWKQKWYIFISRENTT